MSKPGISVAPQKSYDSVADPGFPPGGAPTPKIAIIFQIFAENCMKMKEFGSPGGASLAPLLGPPMNVPQFFLKKNLSRGKESLQRLGHIYTV